MHILGTSQAQHFMRKPKRWQKSHGTQLLSHALVFFELFRLPLNVWGMVMSGYTIKQGHIANICQQNFPIQLASNKSTCGKKMPCGTVKQVYQLHVAHFPWLHSQWPHHSRHWNRSLLRHKVNFMAGNVCVTRLLPLVASWDGKSGWIRSSLEDPEHIIKNIW